MYIQGALEAKKKGALQAAGPSQFSNVVRPCEPRLCRESNTQAQQIVPLTKANIIIVGPQPSAVHFSRTAKSRDTFSYCIDCFKCHTNPCMRTQEGQ